MNQLCSDVKAVKLGIFIVQTTSRNPHCDFSGCVKPFDEYDVY
jgi:hypothetical protein